MPKSSLTSGNAGVSAGLRELLGDGWNAGNTCFFFRIQLMSPSTGRKYKSDQRGVKRFNGKRCVPGIVVGREKRC